MFVVVNCSWLTQCLSELPSLICWLNSLSTCFCQAALNWLALVQNVAFKLINKQSAGPKLLPKISYKSMLIADKIPDDLTARYVSNLCICLHFLTSQILESEPFNCKTKGDQLYVQAQPAGTIYSKSIGFLNNWMVLIHIFIRHLLLITFKKKTCLHLAYVHHFL